MTGFDLLRKFKRLGVYGGSFDPIHCGHLAISEALIQKFALDTIVFIPAFHAPHKKRKTPTPAIDRYAMICLATNDALEMVVSQMEIDVPERPYSVQTLSRLRTELPDSDIFFIIGADSWMDITTWRDWETVLTSTNIVVVTRPGVEITFDHVTSEIRQRITDMRGIPGTPISKTSEKIYVTDLVNIDISATQIREKILEGDASWKRDVPDTVAKYIEKYQIYS